MSDKTSPSAVSHSSKDEWLSDVDIAHLHAIGAAALVRDAAMEHFNPKAGTLAQKINMPPYILASMGPVVMSEVMPLLNDFFQKDIPLAQTVRWTMIKECINCAFLQQSVARLFLSDSNVKRIFKQLEQDQKDRQKILKSQSLSRRDEMYAGIATALKNRADASVVLSKGMSQDQYHDLVCDVVVHALSFHLKNMLNGLGLYGIEINATRLSALQKETQTDTRVDSLPSHAHIVKKP